MQAVLKPRTKRDKFSCLLFGTEPIMVRPFATSERRNAMGFEPLLKHLKAERGKLETAIKQIDNAIGALTAKPATPASAPIPPKPSHTVVAPKELKTVQPLASKA